jgi:ATP-binding protein involved in chromosome partitioning
MAVSERDIVEALRRVPAPHAAGSLIDTNSVRGLSLEGSTARVQLVIETAQPVAADALQQETQQALLTVDGIDTVEVDVQISLATAGSAPPHAPSPEPETSWAERIPGVKQVIAVASGKGGVGKSTVAANLALALAQQGQSVGLLDADIYGPSQQLMMGGGGEPEGHPSGKILPITGVGGVRLMSFGFIVDPDQPVIWRGPMLMKALEQLVGDVMWGELDVLVIDLPPGTGDVALTLCQNLTLAGTVIVTTPQDVALIDARKALHMFRKLSTPVLGLVENMSHFQCPSCGHVEHVFGTGGGERTSSELDIPMLGSIPLDPAVVAGGDHGQPVVLTRPDSPSATAFATIARRISELVGV